MCWTCANGAPGLGEFFMSLEGILPVLVTTVSVYLAMYLNKRKVSKLNPKN